MQKNIWYKSCNIFGTSYQWATSRYMLGCLSHCKSSIWNRVTLGPRLSWDPDLGGLIGGRVEPMLCCDPILGRTCFSDLASIRCCDPNLCPESRFPIVGPKLTVSVAGPMAGVGPALWELGDLGLIFRQGRQEPDCPEGRLSIPPVTLGWAPFACCCSCTRDARSISLKRIKD